MAKIDSLQRRKNVISFFSELIKNYDRELCDFIPSICLDVSTSSTGHMMIVSSIFDSNNELADLLPLDQNISSWDKEQTIITKKRHKLDKSALYPYSFDRLSEFKEKLNCVIDRYEEKFCSKYNVNINQYRNKSYPKFAVAESVFLFQKNAILSLTRFQNTAINILFDRGYIPFEYDNQEAKSLLGAVGRKENVLPLINEMYDLDVPLLEKYSHVGDAIAQGYYHNFIMRQSII